jgi:hypothetical protein
MRSMRPPQVQLLSHCAYAFREFGSTVTATPPSAKHRPDTRSSHPIGFLHRRDTRSAPTVENARRKSIVPISGAQNPTSRDVGRTIPTTVKTTTAPTHAVQVGHAIRRALRSVT